MSIGMKRKSAVLLAAMIAAAICTGQNSVVYAKEASGLQTVAAGSGKAMESISVRSTVRAGAADILDREIVVEDMKTVKESGLTDGIEEDKQDAEDREAVDGKSILEKDYPDLVMANVNDSVNVRAEADEDSELLGKLYKDCAGSMLDQKNGFTRIRSGELEGWVKDSYLLFGEEAESLAREVGRLSATVEANELRIRKEADENAGVYGLLAKGEDVEAVEETGDWVKIQCEGGTEGYISREYVSVKFALDEGETIEEINRREKEEKEAKEAAEKEAARISASRTTETTKTNAGAVAAVTDDVTLLAALIQSEAGNECYEGQLAVGAVVVNRARGRYGSIAGAVYAPGQFGPAASGKVAVIAATGPGPVAMQAAQEALSGVTNVGGATHFRNVRSGYSGIVIGNHVFW